MKKGKNKKISSNFAPKYKRCCRFNELYIDC